MNYVEELLAEALITAPQCPETIVERMLRVACVDFYRETKAWRITTDPLAVIQGVQEVDLELPADTKPVHIYWSRLDGVDLRAVSPRSLKSIVGEPEGFAFSGYAPVLTLDRIPERTYTVDGLVVHMAVAPTNKLDVLPDELYESHRDGILYGAQARLLAMPNVLWGNLQSAMAMASLASAEQLKASREAESMQANVTRVVKYGGY